MKIGNKEYPDTIYVRPDASTALDQDMSQGLTARTKPFIGSERYIRFDAIRGVLPDKIDIYHILKREKARSRSDISTLLGEFLKHIGDK